MSWWDNSAGHSVTLHLKHRTRLPLGLFWVFLSMCLQALDKAGASSCQDGNAATWLIKAAKLLAPGIRVSFGNSASWNAGVS